MSPEASCAAGWGVVELAGFRMCDTGVKGVW